MGHSLLRQLQIHRNPSLVLLTLLLTTPQMCMRPAQKHQIGRLIFIHLQCWEVLPFSRFQRQRCIKIRVLRAQDFYTPLALKIRVCNSGAGNGCANLWTPGKNAFFLQENLHVHKIPAFLGGGGFWVLGGGKADFIFMGAGAFLITLLLKPPKCA